jgi:hypothetical protein
LSLVARSRRGARNARAAASTVSVVEPYQDNIVTFELVLVGYERASDRFRCAAAGDDANGTFTSLFEVLNWAVALEDRVRKHWVPEGERLDWEWRGRVPGGELMGGVRFARNSVHHDWSDALEPPIGLTFPMTFPATFADWQWRPADDLPIPEKEPRGDERSVYREFMEGRPARATIDSLSDVFRFLREVLEPHSLRRPTAR